MKTIAIAAGCWSANIGNSFFNFGARHQLEAAVGDDVRCEFVSDQAAYWNMFPIHYRQEPKNSLRYNDYLRPDYIVLQGSVLTLQLPRVWEQSLKALTEAGTRILYIGAGMFDYTKEETDVCREFFKRYPPTVFISRDEQTYEGLHDLAEHSYNGLDGAYFLPDVFQPIPHDLPPYVAMNFDKAPEPRLRVSKGAAPAATATGDNQAFFDINDEHWEVEFPALRRWLSHKLGKSFNYFLGPLGLCGTNQRKAGPYMIVRADHSINPIMPSRIFRGPNAFAGDIPQGYINLYAQASLTLTDRIHAALVTLAYGHPAMLFSRSGRANIIERVGGGDVLRKPILLDQELIATEKAKQIDFLRAISF